MKNWLMGMFSKEAAKKEDKKKNDTDAKAGKFFREHIKDNYEEQVKIISDVNLAEKITELTLAKKGLATETTEWAKMYEKVYGQVEKNRGKAEKTLLKMLSGDYALLEELIDGKANAKPVKPKKGDPISKKDEAVNADNYDTGRKIMSSKKKAEGEENFDRAYYEKMTKSPGKFEGEPAYVPYFYELVMDGGSDEALTDGESVTYDVFKITDEDKTMFPELLGVGHYVILHYTNDGFVIGREYTEEQWLKLKEEILKDIENSDKDASKKTAMKKRASLRKSALKDSPWKIHKDEKTGKESIIATEDKLKYLSDDSKAKLKVKKGK